MKRHQIIPSAIGVLFLSTGVANAFPPPEKALWIEIRERGDRKSTIAVTEQVARHLLDSDDLRGHFSGKSGKDLITREMIMSVLEGREESAEARDDNGSEAKIYMKDLRVPGRGGARDKLILEIFKSGSRTFRIALPEIEIEASDRNDGDTGDIQTTFGWKALMPFLSKDGGGVYIKSEKDDSEIWIYTE